MHCWQLVDETVAYGGENCLVLNNDKTKKLMLDFGRIVAPLQPLQINDAVMERSDTFGILGLNINNAPSCSENTMAMTRRAQQRLCYIRSPMRVGLSCQSLVQAYRGLLESTLTRDITVWFSNTTSHAAHWLNHNTASLRGHLVRPPLQEQTSSRSHRRTS